MKNYILIFCFLFGFQIYSQQYAFSELDSYLSDYKNFDFEKFKSKEFKNLTIEVNTIDGDIAAKREIDWKIIETIYFIEVSYFFENSFRYKLLTLRVFSQNEEIFLIIYHNDMYDGNDTPQYFGGEEKINSILNTHNKFYQSNLTVENIIKQISDDNVYGYACGDATVMQKIPSYKGYKFNKKSNIKVFRSWIQSFNPELQTYGVDALEYLKRNKNLKLDEQDEKVIKHIKTRNSLLSTCSGCLFGLYEKAFD